MRNSPLTRRLFLAFAAVLLLFALVAGVLTAVLGSRAIRENFEATLLSRARSAAQAITSVDSPFAGENTGTPAPGRGMMGGHHGQGMMSGMRSRDLRFLDSLLMTDIWVLDRQANQITIGTGRGNVEYRDLDIDAKSIVEEVFAGEEVISRQFSSLLGDASLTAGVPIRDARGQITAALLLHEQIGGMDAFLSDTALVLGVAAGLAILAVLAFSAVFAGRFSRPLLQMGAVTRRLAEGETGIRTQIRQNDEIGALAKDIDTLSEKLQDAKERELELEQMRRDFSTKLSHELKTPVAVMRSSLEALRDGVIDDPEEIRQSYDALYAESRQLDRLITDMLELTALQNPKYRLTMEPLDLLDVLRDAVRSQRIRAGEKQIRTDLQADSESVPFVGDYGRLRQMFVTVLNNAVKYSPEHALIQVKQGIEKERVFVSVTNPSPPMKQDVLDQLFTQFYRADDTGPGFGLGLSIAREIAQRHAITIEADRSGTNETRFTFRFPGQPPGES